MKTYCYNCGESGHNYYHCPLPIMSYGMILYKWVEQQPIFCLVQRTYSPEFKELVKGKFDFENSDYLRQLIGKITQQEVNYIYHYSHKTLYGNIQKYYKIKRNRNYYHRYKIAKDKYKKLLRGANNSQGEYIKFGQFVRPYIRDLEPEWGLPKGRRNFKANETDMECAIREVMEETGVRPENYEIKPNFSLMETYYGTNNIHYSHKYYLAKCSNDTITYINPYNKNQVGEIRKIGWYNLDDALKLIRPHHIEKKKLLIGIHNFLLEERDQKLGL